MVDIINNMVGERKICSLYEIHGLNKKERDFVEAFLKKLNHVSDKGECITDVRKWYNYLEPEINDFDEYSSGKIMIVIASIASEFVMKLLDLKKEKPKKLLN